jgi:beta-mannanase
VNPVPPYAGQNQQTVIPVPATIAYREVWEESCWVMPSYQSIFEPADPNPPNPPNPPTSYPNLGIYDWWGTFLDPGTYMAVENWFVSWSQYQPGTITGIMDQVTARDRWLLLTLQPDSDPAISPDPSTLLPDVANGLYDGTINAIAADIAAGNHSLFMRWGHEMEQNFGRYPWSGYPADYIPAYRHVVELFRSLLASDQPNYYIWSPAGNGNAPAYYPGNDVVDYIGISVYSYKEWDTWFYGFPQTFQTIMTQRNGMINQCNPHAPVMICEMGAASATDPTYQTTWVMAALAQSGYYPNLRTMAYFSAPDSVEWPGVSGIPDFTISPALWTPLNFPPVAPAKASRQVPQPIQPVGQAYLPPPVQKVDLWKAMQTFPL